MGIPILHNFLFKQLQPESAELRQAYELILETSTWLKTKGIKQWENPISFNDYQLAAEREEVFGLMIENELMGSVTLTKIKDPYWIDERGPSIYLHRLIVSRSHKGKGYGEMILAWSQQYARENGYSFLRLDCRDSNPILKAYYSSQGFESLGLAYGAFTYALFEMSLTKT